MAEGKTKRRRLRIAFEKARKILKKRRLAFVLAALTVVFASHGAGAQIASPSLWKLVSGAINPIQSDWDLGSASEKIANGYFTNIHADVLDLAYGVENLGLIIRYGFADTPDNADDLYIDFTRGTEDDTQILWDEGDDELRFINSGTEALVIESDGKIGIGTDAPDYGLEVFNGSIKVGDDADAGRGIVLERNGSDIGTISTAGANLTVKASNNGGVAVYDDSNNGIFVEDGGNVGIGTENPSYLLDIVGGDTYARIKSDNADSNTDIVLENDVQQWRIRNRGAVGDSLEFLDNTNGLFPFRVESNSPTNSLYVQGSTGYVGLGTASPSETLDVYGNMSVSGDIFQTSGLNIARHMVHKGRTQNFAGNNGFGQGAEIFDEFTDITDYWDEYAHGKGSYAFKGGIWDGRNIWMVPAYSDDLIRINPATGDFDSFAHGKGNYAYYGGCFDGHYLWMAPFHGDSVTKVDTDDGSMTHYSHSYGSAAFAGCVFDGEYVWLIPEESDTLARVDPSDGSMSDPTGVDISSTYAAIAFNGGAFDGKYVWMSPYGSPYIVRLDPETNTLTNYAHGKGSAAYIGAVFDGTYMWFLPANNSYITKLNPATGEMTHIAHGQGAGNGFTSAAFDGNSIWIAPEYADNILKLNPEDNTIVEYAHGKGNEAFFGAIFDGESVWMVPFQSSDIVRFRPPEFGYSSLHTTGPAHVGEGIMLSGKIDAVDFPDTDNGYSIVHDAGSGGILHAAGTTSSYKVHVQDGHGRVSHLWNVDEDSGTYEYQVSSEGSNWMKISSGDWTFYGAGSGTAGDAISWNTGVHIESDGSVGIGTTSPESELDVNGAIVSGITANVSSSTDSLDVSGVNVVHFNTNAGSITIGGLSGGVAGQVVHLVKGTTANNLKIEHSESTGTQKIYLNGSADVTVSDYGGVTLVCTGTIWFESGH